MTRYLSFVILVEQSQSFYSIQECQYWNIEFYNFDSMNNAYHKKSAFSRKIELFMCKSQVCQGKSAHLSLATTLKPHLYPMHSPQLEYWPCSSI